MSSGRLGSQRPRIAVEPPRADTDGPDAAELTGAYGFTLDEWQRLVLDAWLGRDYADRYTATSCGVSVPRQNGKNAVLEARELYGIAVNGERILHTAHRVDTARKSFIRLVRFFNEAVNPDLAPLVDAVRKTNGQESISLTNGGVIEFSSRVNGGARGSTYDVVVFDEAQELTDDQMESIMSTMSAAPSGNRQLIYTGTPPSPVSPGTVFRRVRSSALDGSDRRLAWHEWSVEAVGDVSDRSRWYETNPALGKRLDEEFTATECATLSEEGFARERLGWWADRSHGLDPAIDAGAWDACRRPADDAPAPDEGVTAYGVKFGPDGRSYALSVAVRRPGEPTWVECVDYGPVANGGVRGIAEWVLARKSRCAVCVLDGRSNTADLEKRLMDGGMPRRAVVVCSPDDVCGATSMLANAVDEGRVAHAGQPDLDESAKAAQKRCIGKGGGYGLGPGTFDCIQAESAALAHWGALTTRRRPGRRAMAL